MSLAYADWIAKQRWFGGRGRQIVAAEPVAVTELAPDLDHRLVRVSYTSGRDDLYQIFVAWDRPLREEYNALATIGADGGRIACDALYDERSAQTILGLIAGDETRGAVRFLAEPGAPIDPAAPPRVSDAEQSNTSVLYDTAAIMKVFRQVVPGLNPDLELNQVLGRFGSPFVPALLGAIEGADPDGTPLTLATLTAFAANSGDGWAMATASARDLLADPDVRPADAGGDFAGEAARIGEAVAAVHATLAEALGTRTGPPPLGWMRSRLDAAAAQMPAIAARADEIRAVIEAADAPTVLQRVHGDLHLGQVLRSSERWLLIDFEGEPGQPIDERRAFDSPMRDVAGMLRSFDYASHQLLVDDPDDERLGARAAEWAQRNMDAFCDGYASIAGVDPRDHGDLLRAYEVDKLVYEVAYESRFRPSWAWIPTRAFDRLFAEPTRQSPGR